MKITVNNVELYYETVGSGNPLILVHGNGESHEIFEAAVPVLAGHFTCYLLDSRGHGKSQNVTEYHYEDMAEDVYQFIKTLSLQNITYYGFSDGGIIGLLLASKHPNLFERMIISGANTSPAAIADWAEENYPDWRRIMKKSPLFKLMMTEPDISSQQLSAITVPTLVLAGSQDVVAEEDTRFIAESIPGASLRILPGEDHDSYITGSRKIADLILEYCGCGEASIPINEMEHIILDQIWLNHEITLDEIVEKSGLSRLTVQRYIRILSEKGCIIRGKGKKSGHWMLSREMILQLLRENP